MVTLEGGSTYRFTLLSGKTIDVVVVGTELSPDGSRTLHLYQINGVLGSYGDLNSALGEPFTKIEKI